MWLLVVFDHFTKFASFSSEEQFSCNTSKESDEEYIYRFGCFETLHSDQGANVDGTVFKGLCDLIDAEKTRTTRTTPYHP